MFVLQLPTAEWKSHTYARHRAHRAHLTHIFGKIAEILDSDEAPNERDTVSLQTALDQIEAKKTTITELDTKILATIEDADTVETEILETDELMYNVAEKLSLIKAVLARPKPLNVQALPFQPQSVQAPVSVSQPVNQPPNLTDSEQSLTDNSVANGAQNQQQAGAHEYANTFTGISHNVSQLPKLTLLTFGGDPLKWQTFWDSFEPAVHTNNVLTDVQKLNYL